MSLPTCLGFVSQKKGFVSIKDKPYVQLSNILMDGFRGGRIQISDNDYPEFLTKYANDVANNRRLTFIECKTGIFKFLIDVDLETKEELPEEEIHKLLKHITNSIKPFLKVTKKGRLMSLMARAPSKEKNGLVKTGLHIVYPNLLVSTHEALLIRENIISELRNIYEDGFTDKGWENAIDAAVYLGSGLRMIGSIKVTPCTACNKRTSDSCGVCAGLGKVDENRPYSFTAIYDEDGNIDETNTAVFANCIHKVIQLSSIRTFSSQVCPEFERFQGAPSYVQPTFQDPTKPPKLPSTNEFSEDKKAAAHWKRGRTIITDTNIKNVCERVVRTRINKSRYGKLFVKEITTDPLRNFYDVKVGGQGSSFCQNKMDDHTNNTIYFHIERNGICQKCFCRNSTIRHSKMTCSKYKSPVKELSKDDVLALFPPSKDIARFGLKKGSNLHIEEMQRSLGIDGEEKDIANKIMDILNQDSDLSKIAEQHDAVLSPFLTQEK